MILTHPFRTMRLCNNQALAPRITALARLASALQSALMPDLAGVSSVKRLKR
jgi:hypothetical protein